MNQQLSSRSPWPKIAKGFRHRVHVPLYIGINGINLVLNSGQTRVRPAQSCFPEGEGIALGAQLDTERGNQARASTQAMRLASILRFPIPSPVKFALAPEHGSETQKTNVGA